MVGKLYLFRYVRWVCSKRFQQWWTNCHVSISLLLYPHEIWTFHFCRRDSPYLGTRFFVVICSRYFPWNLVGFMKWSWFALYFATFHYLHCDLLRNVRRVIGFPGDLSYHEPRFIFIIVIFLGKCVIILFFVVIWPAQYHVSFSSWSCAMKNATFHLFSSWFTLWCGTLHFLPRYFPWNFEFSYLVRDLPCVAPRFIIFIVICHGICEISFVLTLIWPV